MNTLKKRIESLKQRQANPPAPVTTHEAPVSSALPAEGTEVGQCGCGSHVEGECPSCNPSDLPGAALLAKLRELGDRKLVNPDDNLPPAPDTKQEVPVPSESQHKKPTPELGEACPYCHKSFKILSRHKCPDAPIAATEGQTVGLKGTARLVHRPNPKPEEKLPEEPEGTEPDEALSFGLFIDAFLTKSPKPGSWVEFSGSVSSLSEAIARENRAEHWSTVKFNLGAGLLAAKLEKNILSGEYCSSDALNKQNLIVSARSRSPEFRACEAVLRKYASVIVEGVR